VGAAVVVSYPTSVPQDALNSGANYNFDEGELTVPQFIEAINQGQTQGIFRYGKPDVTSVLCLALTSFSEINT